jgi:hypothetical protein
MSSHGGRAQYLDHDSCPWQWISNSCSKDTLICFQWVFSYATFVGLSLPGTCLERPGGWSLYTWNSAWTSVCIQRQRRLLLRFEQAQKPVSMQRAFFHHRTRPAGSEIKDLEVECRVTEGGRTDLWTRICNHPRIRCIDLQLAEELENQGLWEPGFSSTGPALRTVLQLQ